MSATTAVERTVRPVAGFGLCVAGALTVTMAGWVLPDDRAVDPDATSGLGLLAALGLVVSFVVGCHWWSGERGRARKVSGALAGLVFAGVALRCVFIIVAEHGAGLVGRTPLVALYGAILGVAGAGLFALLPGRGGAGSVPSAVRQVAVVGAVGIVLVSVGFAIPTPISWGQVSRSSPPMPAGAIPRSVSEVAWDIGSRVRVDDVVPVTGGVAALTDSQVVGLAGRTGERTWTFGRPGADLLSIRSNGGSRVLVTWAARTGSADEAYLTVLDGASGRVLFTRPQDLWGSGKSDWHVISEHSVVVHRAGRGDVVGYSLDSGERRWTWSAHKGCHITESATWTDSGVVFEQQCADHGQLIAMDDAGVVRWRHRVTMPAATDDTPRGLSLATNLTGTLLTVGLTGGAAPVEYRPLDTRTGHRVAGDRRFGQRLYGTSYAIDRWSAGDPALRDVRTGRTVDAHFQRTACDGALGSIGTDLPGGFVCLSSSSMSGLTESGRAVATMQSWSGAETEIPVDLGAPVDTGDPGGPPDATLRDRLAFYAGLGRVPLRIIAAQGAVVVWAPGSDGAKLVGLR